MAGQVTGQIRVGATGKILVASVGTAAPVDVSTPWTGWVDLGLASEAGVALTDSKTVVVVGVWQLFYAARRIITGRDFTAGFTLRQWNQSTVALAFGGGTFAVAGAAPNQVTTYHPPAPGFVDERALGVEWTDNAYTYRLSMAKGMVTDNVAATASQTAPMDLPIVFSLSGVPGADPWTLVSNDPAMAAA